MMVLVRWKLAVMKLPVQYASWWKMDSLREGMARGVSGVRFGEGREREDIWVWRKENGSVDGVFVVLVGA